VIRLLDNESGKPIGTISEAQLKVLMDQLEEEGAEDQDYYIDGATLDWFEDEDIEPALTALLRKALGSREGMEIRWTKE
jgi:processive 1,2-diacylglycerol beta-glucosyltransferase